MDKEPGLRNDGQPGRRGRTQRFDSDPARFVMKRLTDEGRRSGGPSGD